MIHQSISFIVPVYNAELQIKKCIDSILEQDLVDYEVIVINDGSNDGSLKVINENYYQNDKVRIIDKKNTGVSDTRNTGLGLAEKELIAFVDADDTIQPNMYQEMCKLMTEEVDMVVCSYNVINESSRAFELHLPEINEEFSAIQIWERYLELFDSRLMGTNWNKLFRKEIIHKNNLKFNSKLKMAEDASFNLEYLQYVNKVVFTSQKLYNYVISDSQTTNKAFIDYYDMQCQFYELIKEKLQRKNVFSKCEVEYYNHLQDEVYNSISNIVRTNVSLKEKKETITKIFQDEMFREMIQKTNRRTGKFWLLRLGSPVIALYVYLLVNKIRR